MCVNAANRSQDGAKGKTQQDLARGGNKRNGGSGVYSMQFVIGLTTCRISLWDTSQT